MPPAPSAAEPMDDALSSFLGLRLRIAQAAVWNDLTAIFRPLGMRPQHYAVLKLIATNPDGRQASIAATLKMSPSNLVAVMDELVAAGLIERSEARGDRRANTLALSDVGTAMLSRLDAAQADHDARLSQLLDPRERATLIDLLQRIETLPPAA